MTDARNPIQIGGGDLNPAASVRSWTFLAVGNSPKIWLAMPSALAELFGNQNSRIPCDLSAFSQFQLVADQVVAGFAGGKLRAQYSLDGGGSFFDLESGGTSGDLDISSSGVRVGAYVPIVAAAKADIILRLVGVGGNGIVGPSWSSIVLHTK